MVRVDFMNKKAFTLIELIVTMTIVTLLILTAIPRYNLFIHKQDQAAQAQQIAECIQNGQQKASVPQSQSSYISNLRYTLVVLNFDSTSGITCTQTEHTSSTFDINNSGISQIGSNPTIVNAPNLVICSMSAQKYEDSAPQTVDQPTILKVAFDSLSHGKATRLHAAGATTIDLSAQFNQGINVQFIVSDYQSNCLNNDRQIITIPALGASITVQ